MRDDDDILRLSRRTFSAGAVSIAADLSPRWIEDVLVVNKLLLCSSSAGQGRPRAFCLLDIYMLALAWRIAVLTGNRSWACRSIEYATLAPFPATHQRVALPALAASIPLARRRAELSANIVAAHPLFHSRSLDRPWLIVAEHGHVGAGIFGVRVLDPDAHHDLALVDAGYVLNVTRILRDVDDRLAGLGFA